MKKLIIFGMMLILISSIVLASETTADLVKRMYNDSLVLNAYSFWTIFQKNLGNFKQCTDIDGEDVEWYDYFEFIYNRDQYNCYGEMIEITVQEVEDKGAGAIFNNDKYYRNENLTSVININNAEANFQTGIEEFYNDFEKETITININRMWDYLQLLIIMIWEIFKIVIYLLIFRLMIFIIVDLIPNIFINMKDSIVKFYMRF